MFDALRKAVKKLPTESEFKMNAVEAYDLRKLKSSDLISRGYSEATAEKVSLALLKGDYGPLGTSMGLRLSVSPAAPPLLPE